MCDIMCNDCESDHKPCHELLLSYGDRRYLCDGCFDKKYAPRDELEHLNAHLTESLEKAVKREHGLMGVLALVKREADNLDDALSDLGLESEETVINNATVCSEALDALTSTIPQPIAINDGYAWPDMADRPWRQGQLWVFKDSVMCGPKPVPVRNVTFTREVE